MKAEDSETSAERAGLILSDREEEGITREKVETPSEDKDGSPTISWVYHLPNGKKLVDESRIDFLNSLAVPPAWTEAWFCPNENGHIQATGKDANGRLQYRYHPKWNEYKSILKYSFVDDFAAVLGSLRKQIVLDLNDDGMRKDKVTALVIWLIDRYHIRVGSDQYAMENESYGLTTLKESHLTYIRGKKAEIPGKGEVTGRKKNELPKINAKMMFTGKSGKDWKLYIRHPEIVKLIEESGKVGGKDSVQDVFRYKDNNGKDFDIKAEHINEYLDKHMANRYTAKDFRTWAASWKTAARLAMVSNFSEEFIEKLPQEHEESVEKSKNSGLPPYIIIEQKDRPSVYLKGTEAMAKLAEAKKIPGEGEKERMATMLAVIDTVAADLGNTRAVCRSSYIRPMFMNDWESGVFLERWGKEINRAKKIGGKKEFEKMSLDEVTALLYMKKYESEEFDDALGFENV